MGQALEFCRTCETNQMCCVCADLHEWIMEHMDAEPVRHGEWNLKHIGVGHYWECSVCHTNPCIYVTENTKFCPNCGAKMDGGVDDDAE